MLVKKALSMYTASFVWRVSFGWVLYPQIVHAPDLSRNKIRGGVILAALKTHVLLFCPKSCCWVDIT